MFHLIGFTFIFIIFLLIFGIVAIVSIFRSALLFLLGRSPRKHSFGSSSGSSSGSSTYSGSSSGSSSSSTRQSSSRSHKKLFDDDEGEYVEFEEL